MQFSGPFFEGLPDSYATVEHMTAEDNNLFMTFLNTTATYTGEYFRALPTNKEL
jgi:hypothetical protein